MARPGPKPRRPKPVQLELLELPPAPGFFGAVDRLRKKGELEVARTTAALPDGWALVTTRDGTWRAYCRERHATVTSYTSAGLVRAVAAQGAPTPQLELLPAPTAEAVR